MLPSRCLSLACCWVWVLVSLLAVRLASGDCVHGGTDGFPECSDAGVCTNTTDARHQYCLCDFGRFEMDGRPSWRVSDAKCTLDLAGAAGNYSTAGLYMLGTVLCLTLLVTLTCFTRVCCRRAGREARFERLLVVGTDVLKPTPVQLRFARAACLICLACVTWYLVDLFADPFNQKGTINRVVGFKYELDESDGSARMDGVRLRFLLEDLAEVLAFVLYCSFFVLYRKVCVPAPALLSGTRFQSDWHASEQKKRSLREHAEFVRRTEEKEREEAEQSRREAGDADGDTKEDRDRRWREEEAEVLRNFHDRLLLADAHLEHQLGARIAARERAKERAQGIQLVYAPGATAPPAPPPTPPDVPAPSPSKSAKKYAVDDEEAKSDERDAPAAADEDRSRPARTFPASPSVGASVAVASSSQGPIVAPDGFAAFHGLHVDKRNLLAGIDAADVNTTHNEQVARAGTEEAHAIKIHEKNASSLDAGALPGDDTAGVDESDLASLPVPDALKFLHLLHLSLSLLLLLLAFVANVLVDARFLFSGLLFASYVILHLIHAFWTLTYWAPLYLVSLKEDLLLEAGMPLPKHRQFKGSRGSAHSASTSTVHFGIQTAYELSKAHSLYSYFMCAWIVVTLLQNLSMVYLSYADSDTMVAESAVLYYLLNRLLQCVRVGATLLLFYPFQPLIQYLTLHSFWLDQKLEWGASKPLDDPLTAGVQPILLESEGDKRRRRKRNANHTQQQPEAERAQLPYASQYLPPGLLGDCFPLYISTSFRPIPTRSEIDSRRAQDHLPKLLADLKRMRAIDRETRGGGKTGAVAKWNRLWHAGGKHHLAFHTDPNPALVMRAAENEAFEKAIAHQQFVLWRREQMRTRGWDEHGRPVSKAAKEEHARAERLVKEAEQAQADLAAGRRHLTVDNPFANLHVDAEDASLALAVARVQAKQNRDVQRSLERERVQEEFRKLRAIQRERNLNQAARTLTPLTAAPIPVPTEYEPKMKVKVVLGSNNKPMVVRPAAAALVSGVASATSVHHSSTTASASDDHLLLPGAVGFAATSDELRGVLDEPDDFVSVSDSNRADDQDEEILTPRGEQRD